MFESTFGYDSVVKALERLYQLPFLGCTEDAGQSTISETGGWNNCINIIRMIMKGNEIDLKDLSNKEKLCAVYYDFEVLPAIGEMLGSSYSFGVRHSDES